MQRPDMTAHFSVSLRERLLAHQAAMLHRIAKVCDLSADQSAQLKTASDAHLEQIVETFKDSRQDWWKIYGAFLPDTPTLFGSIERSAPAMFAKLQPDLKSILNESQLAKLNAYQTTREQRVHNGFAAQITYILDSELYLTSDQWDVIQRDLEQHRPLLSHGMYVFNNAGNYLPTVLMTTVFPEPPAGLTAEQLQRYQAQFQKGLRGYARLDENATVDANLSLLEKERDKCFENLRPVMSLLNHFVMNNHDLTAKSHRALELASLGTIERSLSAWNHEHRADILTREYPRSYVRLPDLKEMRDHAIWQNTVTRLGLNEAFATRHSRQRDASLKHILSLLDQELWLTAKQAETLVPILQGVMEKIELDPSIHYFSDLRLLGLILLDTSEESLTDVLHASQLSAWQKLRDCYSIQGEYFYLNGRIDPYGFSRKSHR